MLFRSDRRDDRCVPLLSMKALLIEIRHRLRLELGRNNGGSADSIDQSVECRFEFIVPVKLPSFSAESNQHVERCGQHAEVTNIHAIEIQEAEERSNFLQRRGSFPIFYTLDFDRVHGNGVFPDNNTEIFHFGLFELAFLRFEVEIVDCKDAQDIVHYTAV